MTERPLMKKVSFAEEERDDSELYSTSLSHHSEQIEDEIVTINVAGELFQTYSKTLERYPNSLLGNNKRRAKFFNPENDELYRVFQKNGSPL